MRELGRGEVKGVGDSVFPLEDLVVEVFHVLFDLGGFFEARGAAPNLRGETGVGDGEGKVGGGVILRKSVFY